MQPQAPMGSGAGTLAGGRALLREQRRFTWSRRLLSVPALIATASVYFSLLPAILLIALVVDFARDPRLPWSRAALALAANLAVHVLGLAALCVARVLDAKEGDRHATIAVEMAIVRAVAAVLRRVYGVRFAVEGAEALAPGPLIVLPRHVSLIDPVLVALVSAQVGLRLRWVAKHELIWDPVIDVLAHRLPLAFVYRASHRVRASRALRILWRRRDLRALIRVATDLGPDEGVVVFPESTRFTARKKAREAGSTLRHVLDPRPAGTLAVLEAEPRADVVVFAHTGLERAGRMRDLLAGGLIGATLRVDVWRHPRATIPSDRPARAAWLQEEWSRVDRWLDAWAGGAPEARRPA